MNESIEPMANEIDQQQVAEDLVERARSEGVELAGPDGMLTGLTKNVLETALESDMSEHLGYDKHHPAGRNQANSRNGTRPTRFRPRSSHSRFVLPARNRPPFPRDRRPGDDGARPPWFPARARGHARRGDARPRRTRSSTPSSTGTPTADDARTSAASTAAVEAM